MVKKMKLMFVEIDELQKDGELDILASSVRYKLRELGYKVDYVTSAYNVGYNNISEAAAKFGKPAVVVVENNLGQRCLLKDNGKCRNTATLVNVRKCSALDEDVLCHAFTYNTGKGALTLYWDSFWIREEIGSICRAPR